MEKIDYKMLIEFITAGIGVIMFMSIVSFMRTGDAKLIEYSGQVIAMMFVGMLAYLITKKIMERK